MKSLYINIPFCKRKCLYCDFPTFTNCDHKIDDYLDCLVKEMELYKGEKFRTIYIGGGTPSILSTEQLEKIEEILKMAISKDTIEVSMECNPGTVTREKLIKIQKIGVNRLSFGLQSTHNKILKSIGRIHTYEEFKKNYKLAREIGFKNISADLMFSLPELTWELLLESLRELMNLGLDHISLYSLIIEEGTPFNKMYEEDRLDLPSEEEDRDTYNRAIKLLMENGYKQYEISNFCLEGKECKHNIVYWETKEYVGIGSSSASLIDNCRIKNTNNVDKYIGAIKNNNSPVEEKYFNKVEDEMEEFVFLGLRENKGIERLEFERRFKKKIEEVYPLIIEKFIKLELLEEKEGRIFLTDEGRNLSNTVMCEFILDK